MNYLAELYHSLVTRSRRRLVLIAALLLLAIVGIEYVYTRYILDKQLERLAENEITFKAVLIKSMLNSHEKTVHDYEWDVLRNLHNPDSVGNTAYWMVKNHPYLVGGGMCFKPNFYPSKGRLFEPYAEKDDDEVEVHQIASEHHDYTTKDFYRRVIESDQPYWSDPYIDSIGDRSLICTYMIPLHQNGQVIGTFGLDVSMDWLSDTLNARHMYPSSFALLLTEGGKLIVDPADDHPKYHDVQQVVKLINDSTVCRDSSRTNRTVVMKFDSEHDGEKGYIFYANMRGQPHWQMVVVCYDKEAFGPLNLMTLISLFLLLGIMVALGFIMRHFMRNARRLHDASLEQERLGSELRVASAIQQSMLPQDLDIINKRGDLDVCGMLQPAREVGGDLYEFFVRDEKLVFCIGDVSGKGVPASLVMAVTQALFRAVAAHTSLPANIMRTINQTGCRNNDRSMFVTLFVGVLDLPTGRLRYCNAGHDAPVMIVDGKPQLLEVRSNLLLGIINDFDFEAQECQLPPGSTLLLYTDGVTEAMDANHLQYGRGRLLNTLENVGQMTATQLLQHVAQSVSDFVDGAEQSDDLTMVAVHYTPRQALATLEDSITLLNDVHQTPQLNAFVDQVAGQLQLDTSVLRQIKLAVEEAVVNAMQYAYPTGVTGEIQVTALADAESLRFVIADQGKAFDPTEALRADTTLSVEERPIGGLGILLVRELMDSINYERVGGKNVLTLKKLLTHKS